jgi:Ser/Thr protein kinase RdoA (MazF antagonist)
MSVATAHSMGTSLAEPDWPRLDAAEVHDAVARWGLPGAEAHVIWHSPRPLSAAAIIELGGRRLFIKRHHRSVRSAEELREEHRFIGHLLTHGAAVSAVLRTCDGATAVERGEWTYEIQGVGAGTDLYRDAVSWSPFASSAHAFAAGVALAALHVSARGYDAPDRSAILLVSNDRVIRSAEPLAVIEGLLALRPALADYFRGRNWQSEIDAALAPFHARYLELRPQLEPLWTHNDWHASNLLWTDASHAATVRTVLDFGLSDRTTAVYDLATAIERNTIPWLDIHEGGAGAADLVRVSALLRGYHHTRPLGEHERTALLAILPLVHVGYALTEIDYFHGTTRSSANADLAYQAFLLGHCAWFGTAQGRALLDHVRRELQELP